MLRQIHQRTSLTVKFITAISTVIIGILSALAGNFIFTIKHTLGEQSVKVVRGLESELEHDQVRLKAALKKKREKYGDILQLIAQGLHLNYDYETLGRIAKHSASDNEIAAVVFYDGSGKPLNQEGPEQEKSSLEILRDISLESESSQSLSSGSVMQAGSLEEITSSLNEITAQTKLSVDKAKQANILSNESKEVANDGTVKMSDRIDAMHEIHEAAQNISKIIKVIDEIAFQTNITRKRETIRPQCCNWRKNNAAGPRLSPGPAGRIPGQVRDRAWD